MKAERKAGRGKKSEETCLRGANDAGGAKGETHCRWEARKHMTHQEERERRLQLEARPQMRGGLSNFQKRCKPKGNARKGRRSEPLSSKQSKNRLDKLLIF